MPICKGLGLDDIAFEELPVGSCIREAGAVRSCCDDLMYLLHYIMRLRRNGGLYKMLPHKGCRHIVGMYKVDIVKPVITKYIYYELISREIVSFLISTTQSVYCLDQPGLAAVIIYYPITYMAYRAYGKEHPYKWVSGI